MAILRELAMEISLTSLGSSQTLPLPHLSTLEARRFCSLSDTIFSAAEGLSLPAGVGVCAGAGAREMWRRRTRRLYIAPDGD